MDTFDGGNITESKRQTLVGGLRAVEMFFRAIREIESGDTAFFQSATRLNTPGLGTLPPDSYREVAELSSQCISLFELEMAQILSALKKFNDRDIYYKWLSFYMPPAYLLERGAEQKLIAIMDENEVDTNRICFELPPKILTEGNKRHARNIENLRNRGFHFMLQGFGQSGTPMLKLSEFPVDYVLLSQEMNSYLGKSERSQSAVSAMVDFANGLGATTIADGVTTATQAEALFQAGCTYVAGPLAGKYVLERYVRKKNDPGEE